MTLVGAGRRWTAEGSVTGYGGRRWWQAFAELPAGTTHLRWSYTTDGSSRGRGVYVDDLLVAAPRPALLRRGRRRRPLRRRRLAPARS